MKQGSENRPHCWLQAADSCYWTELTVILNVVFWTTNTLQHTIYNNVQSKTVHKPNKECIYGIFSYNLLTSIIYHVNFLYCTTACWDCNQSVWRLWTADRHGLNSGHAKHCTMIELNRSRQMEHPRKKWRDGIQKVLVCPEWTQAFNVKMWINSARNDNYLLL